MGDTNQIVRLTAQKASRLMLAAIDHAPSHGLHALTKDGEGGGAVPEGQVMIGSSSNVWCGGGDETLHSSVVAPSPQ
jgi:hypothetical protein